MPENVRWVVGDNLAAVVVGKIKTGKKMYEINEIEN